MITKQFSQQIFLPMITYVWSSKHLAISAPIFWSLLPNCSVSNFGRASLVTIFSWLSFAVSRKQLPKNSATR